ncbi:MAG: baseplate J/gp47 family protein [Thermoplasmata archaeon]
MSFLKSFEEILNDILTDYKNQFPSADISQGSLIFIKSACLASALWGLYKYQDYIYKQIFPDTASKENLEHHAWLYGITRKYGETDEELLERLLSYLRRPPAGGNKYDYENWAMEVEGVKYAKCIPLGQGLGTVDVIILADETITGSEIPSIELIDSVKAYIDDKRPVTASIVRVLAPSIITTNISMQITGNVNITELTEEIRTYINSLYPGDALYRAKLINIAVNMGALSVIIDNPQNDISTTIYEIIRPGEINVLS